MKKYLCVILSVVMLISCFLGCAPKTEGFDGKNLQEAEEPTKSESIPVVHQERFSSSDGTVDFNLNINTKVLQVPGTVLEVRPHYLTEADCERAAKVLLGDGPFYEDMTMAYKDHTKIFSRSEVDAMLEQWHVWKTEDWLREYYGESMDESSLQSQQETIERFIRSFTMQLEDFPEEVIKIPCAFQFHPANYYTGIDMAQFPDEIPNQNIDAETEIDGIRYQFHASTRDGEDFKLNRISAFIAAKSGPGLIPESIMRRSLMAADAPPTQEQLDAVQAKAEQMLEDLQLGEWYVTKCTYTDESVGEKQYYRVIVDALPVLQGIQTAPQQLQGNVKDKHPYASNYYMTEANFNFSVHGDLLSASITSPLDITTVAADNAETLPFEELFRIAKEKMTADTVGKHYPVEMFIDVPDILCTVNISSVTYKMSRIRILGSEDSYYYAPALSFVGTHSLALKETGEPYFASEDAEQMMMNPNGMNTFLTLNAVDGSVIYEYDCVAH